MDHVKNDPNDEDVIKNKPGTNNPPNDISAIPYNVPIAVTYHSPTTPRLIFQNQFNVPQNPAVVFAPPIKYCDVCGKTFSSKQLLKQHSLVHTDERKYKCGYCDRAFKQLSHLQQHHRIHTVFKECFFFNAKKGYTTDVDELAFIMRSLNYSPTLEEVNSYFQKYVKGEKPYSCPIEGCSRAFPQLSNLQHHLRHHNQPAPPTANTCSFCGRVYASENVMRNHVIKIHMMSNQPLPGQTDTWRYTTTREPAGIGSPIGNPSKQERIEILPQESTVTAKTDGQPGSVQTDIWVKQERVSRYSDDVSGMSSKNETPIKNYNETDTCLKYIVANVNTLEALGSERTNLPTHKLSATETEDTVTNLFSSVFDRNVFPSSYHINDNGNNENFTRPVLLQKHDTTQTSNFQDNRSVHGQGHVLYRVKQNTMLLPVQIANTVPGFNRQQTQQSRDSTNSNEFSVQESHRQKTIADVMTNHQTDGELNTFKEPESVKHVQRQNMQTRIQPSNAKSQRNKLACKFIPLETIRNMNNRMNAGTYVSVKPAEDRVTDIVKLSDIQGIGQAVTDCNRVNTGRENLHPICTSNSSNVMGFANDNQRPTDVVDPEGNNSLNSLRNHIVTAFADEHISNGPDINFNKESICVDNGNTFIQTNTNIHLNQNIKCVPNNHNMHPVVNRERRLDNVKTTYSLDSDTTSQYNKEHVTRVLEDQTEGYTNQTFKTGASHKHLIQDAQSGQWVNVNPSTFTNGIVSDTTDIVAAFQNEDGAGYNTNNNYVCASIPTNSRTDKTGFQSNRLSRNSRKRKSFCPQRIVTSVDTNECIVIE